MTTSRPDQPPPTEQFAPEPAAERTAEDVRWARVNRKRERIRAEIERNRAGDHKLPTWALAAALGLVVAAWLLLVITA